MKAKKEIQDWPMLWTVIDLRDHVRRTEILSMQEVEHLRTLAPSRNYKVYEVQNYPFIKEENHPLRWLDDESLAYHTSRIQAYNSTQ